MKKIVVFSGSGISAESGIRTFRDSNGLWEEYDISEVATPEAWNKNPALVQRFYNERRKQVLEAQPNPAHIALADLEKHFEVVVITQNIDDLHERAGSSKVIHLHGEIRKSRSTKFANLVYDIDGWELSMDSVCEKGYPLRPFIVWFGEAVPMMDTAISHVQSADVFLVIGTSLEVYPAATLLQFAMPETIKYFIDPAAKSLGGIPNFTSIKEKAGSAVPRLVSKLINEL
ncbi:MAG TPA: NAD-dependent deacylase [Bacteroidia bacterium]|nr:NAD-dependent deacylase [Bacteroidia bacterium]